jgi:hypothetical protein
MASGDSRTIRFYGSKASCAFVVIAIGLGLFARVGVNHRFGWGAPANSKPGIIRGFFVDQLRRSRPRGRRQRDRANVALLAP